MQIGRVRMRSTHPAYLHYIALDDTSPYCQTVFKLPLHAMRSPGCAIAVFSIMQERFGRPSRPATMKERLAFELESLS